MVGEVAKLTDFNAAFIKGDDLPDAATVVGTGPYMAPEILEKDGDWEMQDESYDESKVDIWSLGILIF